jgi:hypothetical protein
MCTPTRTSLSTTNGSADTPPTSIITSRSTAPIISEVQQLQQVVPPLALDHEEDVVGEPSAVANPNTTKKVAKYVSFDPKVRVHLHIHYQNMSSRMIAKYWYSTDEFWAMREDASACIAAAQTTLLLQPLQGPAQKSEDRATRVIDREEDDLSSCCLRGLEHQTLAGSTERLQRKQQGWDAVLREQDRQRSVNSFKSIIVDQEMIARMYSLVSQTSIIEAQVLAMQDELDVSAFRDSV